MLYTAAFYYYYATIPAIIIVLITLVFLLRLRGQLVFGIYPRKGIFHNFKYWIALKAVQYFRSKIYDKNMNEINSSKYLEQLERPQILSDHPNSYDVLSFVAGNMKGEMLLLTMERVKRGIMKACLYLWLPEWGLLISRNLPDMLHFTTDGSKDNEDFSGHGYFLQVQDAMKSWLVKYKGQLESVKSGQVFEINLKMVFRSKNKQFFWYNRDLSEAVIADSVARESWNQAFYMMLKNLDNILKLRMHYEQCGRLEGTLEISFANASSNRIETRLQNLHLNAWRDHSFGTERCLSSIYRYVYVILFLENGTILLVGNLSQPSFFLSSLKVGYIYSADGSYIPITDCNFELYTYGERGSPPQHKNFLVHTKEQEYFIQINAEETSVRYMGSNWNSKIYNQFVSCCVNGTQGYGICEYLYRHKGGRPAEYQAKDPLWYQQWIHSLNDENDCDSNPDEYTEFSF